MAVKVDGLNDIFGVIDNLGEVGKKAGKKAVKNGLDEVLVQLKKDAPTDTGDGARKLSTQYIRVNKNGSAWGACGIGSKNWEDTKHLYFQHYGYIHNKSGKQVTAHVGWMDNSFKRVKKKAEDKMMNVLSSEIDKVLK